MLVVPRHGQGIMIPPNCCNCGKSFKILVPGMSELAEFEGATLDCPHCDGLLIIVGGELRDFHQHLNASEDRWPADGAGTGRTP